MNPYEDSIVKSLREEVSSLQSELSAAVDSYQSNVSALARKEEEVKRLREVLDEDRGEFYLSLRADRDAWKQKCEQLESALNLASEAFGSLKQKAEALAEALEKIIVARGFRPQGIAKDALAAFRESK